MRSQGCEVDCVHWTETRNGCKEERQTGSIEKVQGSVFPSMLVAQSPILGPSYPFWVEDGWRYCA